MKVSGPPSAAPPEYPSEIWRCDECGAPCTIYLTPLAKSRGWYSHVSCPGKYRPEPGRETDALLSV